MFVVIMSIITILIMIVIPAAMWLSHVWAFWCEWGRGLLDKSAGLHTTFWRYTASSFVPLLALTLVFVLATVYSGDDASNLMAMAAACGYISLAISLMRQAEAYERVYELERKYRSEMLHDALYSGVPYEVSREHG